MSDAKVRLHIEFAPECEAALGQASELLRGLPEHVREEFLAGAGRFLQIRDFDALPAGSAVDVPAGSGRLGWVVSVLQDELLAAARAANRKLHGEPLA